MTLRGLRQGVIAGTLAVAFGVPCSAQAFSQCAVTAMGGPGAALAEEGANPVASGDWVYAGFTKHSKTFVVAASDGGAKLYEPQQVSNQGGRAAKIRLAAADDAVYAVWLDLTQKRVMFAANRRNGAAGAWSAPVSLGHALNSLPQISADGANVHVAFLSGGGAAAVVSSSDGGRSFAPARRLGAAAGEIVIASRGRDVYVAFEGSRSQPHVVAFFAASHDAGATFDLTALSDDGKRNAREPIVDLNPDTGRLSLVWREDAPMQGVYLESVDGAKSWSLPLPIDEPARQFMVQDAGDYVYATYLKRMIVDGDYDWQVFIAVSADGGQSFPIKRNLSGPTGIVEIVRDDLRPVPWARKGEVRVTGVSADGVRIWSGRRGAFNRPIFLGPGILASPAHQAVAWEAPNGVIDFGYCHGG